MKNLSTDDLNYYIRRCELLGQTDHNNYRAAVAELGRRM